jgi:hypothetical protein
MKSNRYFSLTKILFLLNLFFAQKTTYSKVFIVRENGKGGAYQLIQDAVMDASQGDTILIDGYTKNQEITLRNSNNKLKFINLNKNSTNYLTFWVYSNDSTQNYSFDNLNLNFIFYGNNGIKTPQVDVQIFNCNFDVQSPSIVGINLRIFNSNGSFTNSNIKEIIGSEITYGATSTIDQDSITIIGCKCEQIYLQNKVKRYAYISNSILGSGGNLFQNIGSNSSIGANGLIGKLNGNIFILNNYLYDIYQSNIVYGSLRTDNNINLMGNVFFSYNNPKLFNLNIEKNNLVFWNGTSSNYPVDNNNTYLSILPPYNVPIDSNMRLVGYDSLIIDQGPPELQYSDVDLSRNDIGIYGGAFPFSNFWGPDRGKSKVVWVDIPKRIGMPNEKIQIKATGTSK